MVVHNKIFELIKKQHGLDVDMDLKNEVYYLFLKDAEVSLWYDEDEKTIKINVEMLPEEKTFVYFEKDISLDDLM